ncbi:MAG: hypothetical protein DSZ28_08330 [Thiothrix sp.]|nr:MAG: hypothetical protein DSZ28_08330 [Thiothrix sp.]
MYKCHILIGLVLAVLSSSSMADAISVSTVVQLEGALKKQNNGNEIVLAPGDYVLSGALYAHGLENITIRSQDANNPAVIKGGAVFRLSQPKNVTIKDLVIQDMSVGGLNIDDVAGLEGPAPGTDWNSTLAHDITLKNIKLLNIGNDADNNDGIKLTGIDTFTIDNVQVINWGGGGSAIDMVGCHNGTIKNSLFRSRQTPWTTGMVTKGGSEGITISNNRFELKNQGIAVKLGGSTENQFFRFWPGQSGYEAKNITVSDNTIIHSRAAVSYVNISEGGLVKDNLIYQSGTQIARILDEASFEGNHFETSNGVFSGNTVIFNNALTRNAPVNIDDNLANVAPQTFTFSSNKWFNTDEAGGNNATGQVLTSIPGTQSGNSFGVDPLACGSFTLLHNQWRQISLPCEPQVTPEDFNNAKVWGLFADDIGDDGSDIFSNYGTDWVIYRYDSSQGEYKEMGAGDLLSQGEGYWIIQVTGSTKVLSMPEGSLPIADGGEPGCLPLQRGCFNIVLDTKPSATQWNMISYPYKTSQLLGNVRVVTSSDDCGSSGGCNLTAAKDKDIVYDTLWTYNGSRYVQVSKGDEIRSWMGYWSPTLSKADGKSPKLRFQRP